MKKYLYILSIILFYTCQADEVTVLETTAICDLPYYIDGNDYNYAIPFPENYQYDSLSFISADSSLGFPIRKFQFLDELNGYAVSEATLLYGELLKTSDGGYTWDLVNRGMDNTLFFDMHFQNKDRGLILNSDFKVIFTDDGGLNWDLMNTIGAGGSVRSPRFDEEGNVYVIGGLGNNDCAVFKSENMGADWNRLFTVGSVMGELEIVGNYIYLKSFYEFIKIDFNGNLIDFTSAVDDLILDFQVINETDWIFQEQFGLYSTNNAGKSWKKIADHKTRIIGFDSVDKGLFRRDVGSCPGSDPDEGGPTKRVIVSTDRSSGECIRSEPSCSIGDIQWRQKMDDGSWYVAINNSLFVLNEK